MRELNKNGVSIVFHRGEPQEDLTTILRDKYILNQVLARAKGLAAHSSIVTTLDDGSYVVDSIRIKVNESKEYNWDEKKANKILVGISETLS